MERPAIPKSRPCEQPDADLIERRKLGTASTTMTEDELQSFCQDLPPFISSCQTIAGPYPCLGLLQ